MASISEIKKEWEKGKEWINSFTRDFPDLDSLADGVALHNVKGAPVVGESTLPQAIRQIPRESIQQIPTLAVEVNGTKLSLDAIVADYLLRRVVFNEDTFGNGILSTMQLGAESALTHGFQPFRAKTGKVFNEFGTVLEALHYNDVVIEPGVFDASDSSYYHVRTRVTKSRLQKLLKAAEANPETKWNTEALAKLIEMGPETDTNSNLYLSEARQNAGLNEQNQYDIITRYEVGPYYKITTYSPQLEDDEALMESTSRSKFGYPRVAFLVLDPAQLTPFGVSRARLASPMENYANIYLQSTAKMQLLNADPPVFKKGLFTTATPLKRGVQWESNDTNADVRLMELSNSTLEQFTEVLRFTSNQILSTMGVNSSGAGTSSSAYQNTASVKDQVQQRSLGSNQVTKILENTLRQYALTALDLYISEQTGQSALIVDDEAKNKINQIMPEKPGINTETGLMEMKPFVGDDNVVNVDWEAYYDRIQTWTVTVDLSMAKNELEDKKRADLQDQLTVMSQTSNPNDPSAVARVRAVEDELLQDVVPEVTKELQQQPTMPPQQVAVGGPQSQPQQ